MDQDTSKPSHNLLRIVRDLADYQFGRGVGDELFPEDCRIEVSKRTGRPRYIYLGDKLLATIRYPDNLLALSLEGAERLRRILGKNAPRIVVKRLAVEKLLKGLNPTARDLLSCSPNLRPGDEVIVEDADGRLIAVGRAIVSSQTMKELRRGAIVKIRKVLKT